MEGGAVKAAESPALVAAIEARDLLIAALVGAVAVTVAFLL